MPINTLRGTQDSIWTDVVCDANNISLNMRWETRYSKTMYNRNALAIRASSNSISIQ